MTPERPADTPGAKPLGVRATVGAAWSVVRRHPRETILPALVVQTPVALIISVVVVAFYFTGLRHEQNVAPQEVLDHGGRGAQFLVAATAAAQGLFGQVARAASILGIAGVHTGRPLRLVEALDPAFTRMGTLLALAIAFGLLLFGLAATVVLLPLALYLALRLALAFEFCIIEKRGVGASLAGSWRLLRGSLLRFALGAIVLAATLIGPFAVISLLNLAVAGGRDTEVILYGITSFVTNVLVTPLVTVITAYTTISYLKLKGATSG